MKRSLLAVMLSLAAIVSAFGQMSDTQVMDFVRSETKRGTTQSQIVTKLMERGVQIEQIRRIRNQYEKQVKNKGVSAATDNIPREVTIGRRDTTSVMYQDYQDATEEYAESGQDKRNDWDTQDVQDKTADKRVFGRDVFNQRTLSFEPNMNLATPQNYVLGPGDQLVIDIYGASQKTLVHTVSPEGTITIENVGPVAVNGLTVSEAQRKIRTTVGAHYSTSDVRLTLGQTRTIMINVMGEVKTPGTYHLSAFATVFHALYRAGGINQLGTLRNVKVYRNGRLVTVVDIYEYILNGRLAGNVMLQDGDVIQVDPYECLVDITGNVKRPMYYEMRKSETVGTLIKYAGGFMGNAYKKMVRLVRQTGERYTVHNVDEFEMNAFTLDDGDVVSVDSILNRYENMVEIKGAVFRPGMFNLNGNVCSVRSLIQAAAGLTEDAFLDHAIIHRLKEDRSLEVIPVDVKGIMDGTAADIPLKNEDVVFIPTQEEWQKERFFTVTGEVMTPGTYQYADNTTIEDLIVQAGGLRDGASLARVDVSRRIDDPYSTEKTRDISETFQFDLKDGLVVNEARQFILKPYDVVHVRRSPGYVMPKNITVTGEVNYEGAFTLEKKSLRLTDAIQMAGGVTKDAYTKGARLIRQMNEEERARKTAVLENITNTLSENDSVVWNKINLQDTYMIGIDLAKALANPGSFYDIVLRENDIIEVPEYNGTVAISGDVQFPNTITYVEGKNYKWYVKNAGGFSETAKKKKTFIVYQNGMMDNVSRNTKVEPGSMIVVPSKKKKHFDLSNFAALSSVLTPLVTIATLVSYLTK